MDISSQRLLIHEQCGVTGVVGGGVSPGLTIMSFLERTKRYDEFDRTYACAAAIAVTMMFPGDFVVFGIVSPSLARSLVLPFVAMAGVSVTVTGLLWSRIRTREPPTSELDIPFHIRPALVFGAVIAAILDSRLFQSRSCMRKSPA